MLSRFLLIGFEIKKKMLIWPKYFSLVKSEYGYQNNVEFYTDYETVE